MSILNSEVTFANQRVPALGEGAREEDWGTQWQRGHGMEALKASNVTREAQG